MAFSCCFDFEAEEKCQMRRFDFETTDGLKWCIEERWQIGGHSPEKGASEGTKGGLGNHCIQKISIFILQQEFLSEDRYFAEVHLFNPQNPLLGAITKEQALHLNNVIEVPLSEYVCKFSVTLFEQPLPLRCNMNFFPLYDPEFTPPVPLRSEGTVVPVKQIEIKKALENVLVPAQAILKKDYFSDVVIVCGTAEFRASRNILAAKSPVLAIMFEELRNRNRFHLPDIDPHLFQEVLSFLHTGTLLLNDYSDVVALLNIAEAYLIEDLKKACFSFLEPLGPSMPTDIPTTPRPSSLLKRSPIHTSTSNRFSKRELSETLLTANSKRFIKPEPIDTVPKSDSCCFLKQEPLETPNYSKLIKQEPVCDDKAVGKSSPVVKEDIIIHDTTTGRNRFQSPELPDDCEEVKNNTNSV